MITTIRFSGVGVSAFGSMISGGVSAFPRNAVGFIHALERKLNQKNLSLGPNRRVAVGIENYRLHKGEKNYTSSKMALSKPWKNHADIANSVLDSEWKCNVIVTLVVLSDGVKDIQELKSSLEVVTPSMRFANGSIFVKDSFVDVRHDLDSESLGKSVKAVKASRASFFTCRSDLINESDEFNSFVNSLALFEVKSENVGVDRGVEAINENEDAEDSAIGKKWERANPGWIIPVERGYLAVTLPIANRPASRHPDIPTIVVTPVIGLGEFISSKRFISSLDFDAFWASKSDRAAGFYLFNATSFNS